MSSNIHIGTSGFSYRHWRDDFYPKGLPAKAWFAYYAGHFSCVEINASFYRLPNEETVARWSAEAPEGFLFCPKMSRYLSHMKKLRDPQEPLARFFNIFEALMGQMGPVLVQLPDRLKFYPEIAGPFYEALQQYKPCSTVLEVRHESWLTPESLRMMEIYDIGLVINSSGVHWPYSELVTSADVYLRFHGPRELYASSYSDEELKDFAGKIHRWAVGGKKVWAFFNNDIHGFAPRDAARLKALLA